MKNHIRHCILLLLVLCLTATVWVFPTTVYAKTVTVTADGINVARGTRQLILYTPAYGATTNTNEWGVEAVVGHDNRVKSVGGNNVQIPAGGFVLSGHDDDFGDGMKTWITENVKVGDYVYYDASTLQVTVSDKPAGIDSVFYALSTAITGVNRVRYENDLILFTSAYGRSTRSNEYGYEVAVRDGLVASVGGNSTEIPTDGFVVSGHGVNADWLRLNVRLGMRAEYDTATMTVTFHYDAEGLEAGLSHALDDLQAKLQQAKADYLYMDYDGFDASFREAKKALSDAVQAHNGGGDDRTFANACDEVNASVQRLTSLLSESKTVQYRAVWVRPSQRSAEEIDAYVKLLHDQGINTICVEGNYDNGVIMNVPKGSLFVHNTNFNYDVLQAYIDACHKYGMECHLWMAIFLNGYSYQANYAESVPFKHRDWLSLSQNGTPDNPDGFMMLDPANEEAREYLLSFYEYILHTYDIDGFELDYIRYYVRTAELDFGYTEAAFAGFEEEYHHGVTPTYDTTADYWADWVQYRKDCVTKMVEAVRELIDRWKPDVVLGADVVPNPDQAGFNNYQDYLEWERQGWLDILHPMAYGDGFGDSIRRQVELGGDRCSVVTGLGAQMEAINAWELVRQAIQDNQLGAFGDCFFEATAYLNDNAGEALLQTVYRDDAIPPFLDRDASLKAILSYMAGRVDDVLLPFGGVTEDEASSLRTALENASGSVGDSRIGADALAALRDVISSLADGKARTVLESDLLYAERIVCATYKVGRDELTGELTLPKGEAYPPSPDEPEKPDEPGKPDVPENPGEPEKPDVPEKPSEPETPGESENPDEPEKSATPGDVNGDGTLNANDYMMLKRYVLHTFNLTADQLAVADINADGDVNANDYMILKRAVLGTYKLPTE